MIWNATVKANSSNESVEKTGENNLKVRVFAPALNGRANARLIEVLAGYFKISKSKIRIVKGFKSKKKIIEIG